MTQDTPDPAGSRQPLRPDDSGTEDRSAKREGVNTSAAPVGATTGGRAAVLGAVFLMATSAIGPGFITQTATYTIALGAAFACAIAISIVVDIAVQMNVWRVVGVSGQRAHELGNAVSPRWFPWIGYVLAGLVVLGGLVFNIGNTAGAGLGTNALLGIDPRIGGSVSAAIAVAIFLSRRAGVALDRIVVVLGLLMIVATLTIAVTSSPPVGEALRNVVAPAKFDFLATTTIIGGTVGGYITYAGAHRLLDSGLTGPEHVRDIARSSVVSILVTGLMRVLLFLAILGVVAGGAAIAADDPSGPAGAAFRAAAGEAGLRVFGLILWAAALTSVIGAAYTSVSFMTTSRTTERARNLLTVGFIVLSAVIFVIVKQAPTKLLIFAGTFNGLILPIGFGVLLYVAWRRRDLLHDYAYPRWLLVVGVAAWLLTLYLGWNSLQLLGTL